MIRVLVVDDHPIYREGIARAIDERAELDLVGECACGVDALHTIEQKRPDVALLDMRLPDLSALDILRNLQMSPISTKLVVLSANIDSAVVYDAVAAGAAGYLSKDADRKTICDAVVSIASGGQVFSDGLQAGLVEQIQARARHDRATLTPREREILGLVADGHSTAGIAAALYLGETTVKTHLKHLYEKLGVSERAAAVAEAMRRGLLR